MSPEPLHSAPPSAPLSRASENAGALPQPPPGGRGQGEDPQPPPGGRGQGEGSLVEGQNDPRVSVNLAWVLLCGFLVFFMQAGFAMVETGLTRAKNVAHTMAMNVMIFSIGSLGFWACGFALMFGNHGRVLTLGG